MKNKKKSNEYDFSLGIRGKYSKKYNSWSNIVILSPEVSKVFKDSYTVNEALRSLMKLAKTIKRSA